MTATEALEKLQHGNEIFVAQNSQSVDVSAELLQSLEKGQSPFAVVVCCSDSRVVPEVIFNVGLGEIFTVRLAGNVVDGAALGSIQYAVEHLHCPLVVVMGHEHCGAVHAAISGGAKGPVKQITDAILAAAGSNRDETTVCKLNVKKSVATVESALDVKVVGAYYHLASGKVEII